MIDAVRNYLSLLQRPPGARQRLQALAEALDLLALAYHRMAEASDPSEYPAPPGRDETDLRRLAAQAFPDFGFYCVVPPDEPTEEAPEVLLGDAIDDLADIASDLEAVLWRWENTSRDDAAWHFRLGYRSHWGRHLHDLRSYVHARERNGS